MASQDSSVFHLHELLSLDLHWREGADPSNALAELLAWCVDLVVIWTVCRVAAHPSRTKAWLFLCLVTAVCYCVGAPDWLVRECSAFAVAGGLAINAGWYSARLYEPDTFRRFVRGSLAGSLKKHSSQPERMYKLLFVADIAAHLGFLLVLLAVGVYVHASDLTCLLAWLSSRWWAFNVSNALFPSGQRVTDVYEFEPAVSRGTWNVAYIMEAVSLLLLSVYTPSA